MKKASLLISAISISLLFILSCDKPGDWWQYDIKYACINNTHEIVTLVYIGADGKNVFEDVQAGPGRNWHKEISFKRGDYVSIQAQCNATYRTVTISIDCDGCRNIGNGTGGMEATIDCEEKNIVELSKTID